MVLIFFIESFFACSVGRAAADAKVYKTRFYNLDDQLFQLESGN